jgi:hypothetical protein
MEQKLTKSHTLILHRFLMDQKCYNSVHVPAEHFVGRKNKPRAPYRHVGTFENILQFVTIIKRSYGTRKTRHSWSTNEMFRWNKN